MSCISSVCKLDQVSTGDGAFGGRWKAGLTLQNLPLGDAVRVGTLAGGIELGSLNAAGSRVLVILHGIIHFHWGHWYKVVAGQVNKS